jgi:hypothetical protein
MSTAQTSTLVDQNIESDTTKASYAQREAEILGFCSATSNTTREVGQEIAAVSMSLTVR